MDASSSASASASASEVQSCDLPEIPDERLGGIIEGVRVEGNRVVLWRERIRKIGRDPSRKAGAPRLDLETVCRYKRQIFKDGRSHLQSPLLGPGHLKQIAQVMIDLGLTAMTHDTLIVLKAIVGRWLKPKEMLLIFGSKNRTIFWRRHVLTGVYVERGRERDQHGRLNYVVRDPRVSTLFGMNGTHLQKVTEQSKCLFVWLDLHENRPVVEIHALDETSLSKAFDMLNARCAAYDPYRAFRAKHGGEDGEHWERSMKQFRTRGYSNPIHVEDSLEGTHRCTLKTLDGRLGKLARVAKTIERTRTATIKRNKAATGSKAASASKAAASASKAATPRKGTPGTRGVTYRATNTSASIY